MSSRSSFQRFLSVLIALFLLSAACSSGPKAITREQVLAFLEDLDKAAQRRDVEAIIAHISPNAQLKLTMEGFGSPITLPLNRDQYRDHADQGFKLVDAYEYTRGETVIKIEPDGQTAFVADETFETVTIRGKVMRTVTRGTATIKLENGSLMITSSHAVGRPDRSVPSSRQTNF